MQYYLIANDDNKNFIPDLTHFCKNIFHSLVSDVSERVFTIEKPFLSESKSELSSSCGIFLELYFFLVFDFPGGAFILLSNEEFYF